jgi:hypothetical protein
MIEKKHLKEVSHRLLNYFEKNTGNSLYCDYPVQWSLTTLLQEEGWKTYGDPFFYKKEEYKGSYTLEYMTTEMYLSRVPHFYIFSSEKKIDPFDIYDGIIPLTEGKKVNLEIEKCASQEADEFFEDVLDKLNKLNPEDFYEGIKPLLEKFQRETYPALRKAYEDGVTLFCKTDNPIYDNTMLLLHGAEVLLNKNWGEQEEYDEQE